VVASLAVRLRFFVLSSLFALFAAACVPDDRPQRAGSDAGPAAAGSGAKLHVADRRRPQAPFAGDAGAVARNVVPGPRIETPFSDNFDRTALGPDWNITGGNWALHEGRLCVSGAHNHPAWLSRRLPLNARIEFEATSGSPEGDLKAEVWGDGVSAATSTSYTNATSYIVIFGGWKNTFHVLARLDEHAPDRTEMRVEPGETDPRAQPALPDRAYRFKIERSDGKTVRYFVDDIEILSLKDPSPLSGEGHEHLGFNDWVVPVCFDNLTITPLKS
jgi:hypothetical protein